LTTVGQITISLPSDLEEQVRHFAERNGFGTLSDFVRDVLRERIAGESRLSYWDRAMFVRVLEIHQAVTKSDLSPSIDAMKDGYSTEYRNSLMDVSRREVGTEVSSFVMDVLECYENLQRSARALGSDALDEDTLAKLRFMGFDGNNEIEYLGYVRYLYETNRYVHVEGVGQGINSHMPTIHIYRRMLAEWRAVMGEKAQLSRVLTKSDIERVLAAQIHPDHR
jgi:uncharacterized protein YfbU (UPF0304 family)